MDVQTGLVCVVLVIISGAILLFISMFGMREKTYEEAIAEQRKMPDDALLLGRPHKDKNKKQKRQGKKVKEKPVAAKTLNKDSVKSQSSTETDSESTHKENEHTHVNFLSPEAEILNVAHPDDKKNKKKKDKVKPILLNKEEPAAVKEKPGHKDVTVNHFTEIIPKDDLQLKMAASKSNPNLNNSQAVQINSNEMLVEKGKGVTKGASKENNRVENDKNNKNEGKMTNHSNKVHKNEKVKNEQQQAPAHGQQIKVEVNGSVSNSSVEQSPVQQQKISIQQMNNKEQKNKKHKKNDLSCLHQMNESVNIQLLIPLIRKAELSRTEVQVLTDILLTKHFDEVSDHFEWIEGRQDPVVKLKKQLAEKERALAEEQEASQAFQNKLKELRSEYNAERARLTQACRQYDESVLAKQGEIQNLHATNRHLMDNHVAEKQALTQKIQQLQAQVNDENLVIRKLQEDHNQTQNALQQELVNQRQQMEMHIGRLSEQLQEAQKNLEAQIHAKIQEAEQIRASFNTELQKNRRYEEELRELREQHVQSQNKIKSLESRASQLKESSSHSQELVRQIEELQRTNKELDKRLGNTLQSEEELKFEKSKLQNEIHGFTNKVSELQGECEKLAKDREKLSAQMVLKMDLEKDLARMKEENQCLISQVSSFTKIEREAQQLREENENLAAQVTAFTERPAADGRENGDSLFTEEKKQNINAEFIHHENETNKQKDVIIEKLAKELKGKEILMEELNEELTGCRSEISRLASEVAKYKTEVSKLREELEGQRNKNNDLRQKNWKAMEALASTEKSLESNLRETDKLAQERQQQEQQASRNLLERLFPNIKIELKSYEDWINEFENSARNYLEGLESESQKSGPTSPSCDSNYLEDLENKNAKLESLVAKYKTIVEDTEGMLNQLQNYVEQEEIRWRQQCEVLESQVQNLKENQAVAENSNAELKSKVKELEEKMATGKEGTDQESVRQENSEWMKLAEAVSERSKELSEENEELNSKLAAEQEKSKELNKELIKLRSTVKFGQDAYVEENKKRLEVEEELKLLKSKNNIRGTAINNSADFMASEGKPMTRKSNWDSLSGWLRKKIRKRNSTKSRPGTETKMPAP